MKRTIFLLFLLVTASASYGEPKTLSYREQIELFTEANTYFHQANTQAGQNPTAAKELYRQAIMRFERIAGQGGVRNGKLYYNIGNAYFRMGDLGRAILYYERAAQYIPNNPDLRQNLSYAQSRCQDSIPETQQAKVLKTLFFWHYDFSQKTKAVLFTVFFVSLCLFVVMRLWVQRAWVRGFILASAAISLLMLGSLATEAVTEAGNKMGIILNPEITARKGDGETYQPSFKEPLHAGTKFRLVENRGEWYYIELSDGRSCWVPAKAAGLI